MSSIDSAFDDAYRSYRVQAGDDARTLPNPYARPSQAQEAGGFVAENVDAGGGFLPDQSDGEDVVVSRPSTIPLTSVPEALANLGLDASDAHVLSIFANTAYTPASAGRRLPQRDRRRSRQYLSGWAFPGPGHRAGQNNYG